MPASIRGCVLTNDLVIRTKPAVDVLEVVKSLPHSLMGRLHLRVIASAIGMRACTNPITHPREGHVFDTSLLGRDSLSGRLGSLDLGLFLLWLTTFGPFLLSLLALFLFFSSDTDSFSFGRLILIKFRIDPFLDSIFFSSLSFNDSLDNLLDFFRHFSLVI